MPSSSFSNKFIDVCSALLPQHSSVVVAVSGGSDSVALFMLLHQFKVKLGIEKLVVAHVNYGLRGDDSDGDEEFVRAMGGRFEIPVFVKRVHGHTIDEPGMELWAREERYHFFEQVCRDNGCSHIATGHTLNDQAETVLMRLIRGSGLNGLRGIAPLRGDGVFRPLLSLQKAELLAWLDSRGFEYRNDGSNGNTQLFRNHIRHNIVPQLEGCQPGVLEHLAALADEARGVAEELQPHIAAWITTNYHSVGSEFFRVLRSGCTNGYTAADALRQLFEKHSITPDRPHILRFTREGLLHDGGTYLLPDGWYATVGKKELYFEKKVPVFRVCCTVPAEWAWCGEQRKIQFTVEPAVPYELDAGRWTVYIDAEIAGDTFIIRPVAAHDLIIPFGRKKEITVHEFLAKQGMVKPDRDHAVIITTQDNKTVWIHGIRLDGRFRVTSATKSVIKIQSSSIL